uniref:Uncharacterized protein n=1 Tax=uncultured bacterium contig00026 TaxID=1181515 RepID=A0A806JXY5_9BACT|nr:hypothetical protein [uncultured bacterium contig00026]
MPQYWGKKQFLEEFMLKRTTWVVAVLMALSLVFLGCPSGNGDDPPEDVPFEFEGTVPLQVWGSTAPVLNDDGSVTVTASSSSGFWFSFAAVNYTYNRNDVLVITYEVDVTTPAAAVSAKNPNDWGTNLTQGDWGKGKGREYVLGDPDLSVYDGPNVAGTYDAATKTGTIEVIMSYFPTLTGLGFQHNYWCDMGSPGTTIAENSVYTVKFTKIENKVIVVPDCLCVGCAGELMVGDECVCGPGDCDEDNCGDCCEVVPYVPPSVDGFVYNLGEYTWINNATQKGWGFGGADGDLDWTLFQTATHVVIVTGGEGINTDGFGGIDIVLQGAGNSWGWAQKAINTGWKTFARDEDEIVFIVVPLADIGADYTAVVAGANGKFLFQANADIGILGAVLTNLELEAPEDAVDLTDIGYATKENPLGTVIYDLGEYTWINNATQKGWGFGGADGDLDWAIFQAAQYVVIVTGGEGINTDGFGGIDIVLQGAGNSWGWAQKALNTGWKTFARDEDEYVYIVVPFADLGADYTAVVTGANGKFLFQANADVGILGAYLVALDIEEPEDAVALTDIGYATRTLPFF